jgi:hypothetical protein
MGSNPISGSEKTQVACLRRSIAVSSPRPTSNEVLRFAVEQAFGCLTTEWGPAVVLPEEPLKAIFALFKVKKADPIVGWFLGTGFFVDHEGGFLTARHNLDGVDCGPDEQIAVAFWEDPVRVLPVATVRLSDQFDIAYGHVSEPENIVPLTIASSKPMINEDILTLEFSNVAPERGEDGIARIMISATSHKGYVARGYQSTFAGTGPAHVVEVSFPALKGASGAPVVVERLGTVLGMLVANVERELLPAQVEVIEHGDGTKEDRKYFLPRGLAIAWIHLRDFLDSVKDVAK